MPSSGELVSYGSKVWEYKKQNKKVCVENDTKTNVFDLKEERKNCNLNDPCNIIHRQKDTLVLLSGH